MTLYKYMTQEAVKSLVTSGTLWARPFNQFNDIFEGLPQMTWEALIFDFRILLKDPIFQQRMYLKHRPDPTKYSLSDFQRDVKTNDDFVKELLGFEMKYRGFDPVEMTMDIRNKFSEIWGLISFSTVSSHILMWSHYANEHKGYVVAVDSAGWRPENELHEVGYSSKRFKAFNQQLNDPKSGNTFDSFTLKARVWRYEREYRYVARVGAGNWEPDPQGSKKHFEVKILPRQLLWVCAGAETPVNDYDEIQEGLTSSLFKFPDKTLYKASRHKTRFEITLPKEIRPKKEKSAP